MESRGKPEPEEELFEQLKGLGEEIIDKYLKEDLEHLRYKQGTLKRQRRVLEVLREKESPFVDFILIYLSNDPSRDLQGLLNSILNDETLDDELRLKARSMQQLYSIVARIADEIDMDFMGKRALQVEIMTTELLPAGLKTILLEAVDDLVGGEGYDTSDPVVMLGAIAHHRAEEEQKERWQACRARANELLEEENFLDRYNIHPDDPVWLNFRGFAAFSLTQWVLDEEKVDSVAHHLESQAEVLQRFGIDHVVYTSLLERVKQTLSEEFG